MATVYSDVDQNWTALTYASGDTIQVRRGSTLTINASVTGTLADQVNVTEPGSFLHITNTSTTTPIAVNVGTTGSTILAPTTGGKLLVEGDKISIGTGNGVAGQTFTLPTTDTAANMPLIGGIFSEQGATLRDGTVVPTLHSLVDSTLYGVVINDEKAGDVYTQDTTANTVTFKRAIPNGVNVYIPNIFIVGQSSSSSGGLISTNANGAFSGNDFGITDGYLSLESTEEETVLDHVVQYTSKSTVAVNCQPSPSGTRLTNTVWTMDTTSTHTSYSVYSVQSHKSLDLRNIRINAARSNALRVSSSDSYYEAVILTNSYSTSINAYYPLTIEGASNVTIRDLTSCAPSTVFFNFCKNLDVDGLRLYPAYRTDSTSTYSPYLMAANNNTGAKFTNVEELDDAVTGMTARRFNKTFLVSYNTDLYMSDITVNGSSSATSTDRWTNILNPEGTRNTFQNFTVNGQINSRMVNATDQIAGGVFRNIYCTASQTYNTGTRNLFGPDALVDRVSSGHSNATVLDSQPAGVMRDCGSFLSYKNGDTDKTAGQFTQYINPSIEDPRTVFAGTTTSKFEYSRGLAYLRTDPGVDVVITSDVHTGVVGCTSTGWLVSGFTATQNFEVRRRGGAWSTPATYNSTNVNSAITALTSSADNEVQFRFTLTGITGTSVNSYVGNVMMDLTLDGSVAPSEDPSFDPDSEWNNETSNHTVSGSFGEMLQQIYLNTLNTTVTRAT